MAAGTRPETKTLDRVCALAAAQPGIGSARVSKGYRPWSENEHFQAQVRALAAETQGYFWAALDQVAPRQASGHAFRLVGELALYVPAQAATDLNAAWEFALALRDALENPAAYGDGEFPMRLTVRFRGVEALAEGGVAIFDFGAGSGGSLEVPAL